MPYDEYMKIYTKLEKPTPELCRRLSIMNNKSHQHFAIDGKFVIRENHELIVARNEYDAVLGFLTFKTKRTAKRYSSFDIRTFVRTKFQGKGVGRKLVLHHLRLIERRKKGAQTLTVKSVVVSKGGKALMKLRRQSARIATVYEE